ncbi:hypothetical protein B0H10DRAFT_2436246 [Mycena sp. CBHHK59/15]|nr:hypothetical protein B0H10DRAFT_2436246 [Mycena sp. CBHHK59/15]
MPSSPPESPKPLTEADAAPPPATADPGQFAWVLPALKTPRTLKTWLRCVLATVAAMVLLVDNASLNSMGQAGFFAAIISMMLPPMMALSVFALASITLLLGMLLGWAWGAATMAAGLAVQDAALLAQRTAAAQATLVNGVPPATQLAALAFHGYFLDARTSAVYGAMFFVGTFFMGALRAHAPKLALLSIFGTIVLDIFCVTGPLLPTAQYTIAKQFLLPTAYYVAIALAALVFVFPESLNHVWLTALEQAFFEPTIAILSLQSTALASLSDTASPPAALSALTAQVAAARQTLAGGLAALVNQIALVDLEASVGRLGPADLKVLAGEMRALGLRASGLLAFQTAVQSGLALDAASGEEREGEGRFVRRRRGILAREARHGHTLAALVPILAAASAPLRATADAGTRALRAWCRGCNARRWTGFVFRGTEEAREKEREERQSELLKVRDELDRVLKEFREVERARLIGPFERFFDRETGRLVEGVRDGEGEGMFAVRSLFICFVFCDTLDAFATRVLRVLTLVVALDKKRPAPRIWLPSGFGKLWRRLLSRDAGSTEDTQQPLAMGTASDPTKFEEGARADPIDDDDGAGEEEEEEETPVRPRNPDARAPTSALGRLFVKLGGLVRLLRTPEGIFALRHAVVSLALWVPAVIPRSAWFFYANKGVWALIMAQTGLAVFAGDQLAGLATRLLGTAVGLLVGMVVWYVGAPGRADGNPYAVVVVTAVFVAPFLFGRIAAPPAQSIFYTMIGVTTVFVVGVGIDLGWKRALLVIIGFTAGAIVMLFPRPTSSRTLVRRTLAATIRELGNIFGQEVEAFLAEEARARSGPYGKETIDFVAPADIEAKVSAKERRVRNVAQRVLVVSGRLQALAPSLKTGQMEPQVQGLWPHEQYELLHIIEMRFITSLALLAGAFSNLDTKWCSILVHRTPFLNPNLLSDIFSHIDIISHALEAGHPLPASLPCLRDRLVYHESHARSMSGSPSVPTDKPVLPADIDAESESGSAEFVAGKVDGSSIGFEELSLSVLMDEQLPTHSTAVIALGSILTAVDEITAIVRELCGETTFRGFDALHYEYVGREEAATGSFPRKR